MMSLPGLGRETLEWDIRFPYIEGSESLDSLLLYFQADFLWKGKDTIATLFWALKQTEKLQTCLLSVRVSSRFAYPLLFLTSQFSYLSFVAASG